MDVPAVVKNDLTWLQKHETLVLAAIAGVILWLAIGKIDTLVINHDAARLKQAQATALIQESKNEALATAAQQAALQYKALAEQVTKQNLVLEQNNAQLVQALAQRQKTDATLPPNALAQRWNTLVPTATATVTPSGITVPQSGAVSTVQELEKVPALTEELDNTKTQLDHINDLLEAGRSRLNAQDSLIDGLNLQIKDNAKVCEAQVAEVKAQARKSKRTWFTVGYVAGLATRGAIRFLTGF